MESEGSVKSVVRAAELLRLLGERAASGGRLSDLARDAGFGKTTTHRLLSALCETGLAVQDAEDRRYHLGYELIRLGRAALRYDVAELARPALMRLARETGDTVFLSVREGMEAVCLDRAEGAFPIKTLTLNVGDRRPLGVGAGAMALLAFLPEEEIAEIVESLGPRLGDWPGYPAAELPRLAAEARARGHAHNGGRIVPGMTGVGVPVRGPSGGVAASLSLAAVDARMTPDRIAWIAELLAGEAAALEARLAGPRGPARRTEEGAA